MNRRTIQHRLEEALQDTPVVFLRGARQTGKTTLVQWLGREGASVVGEPLRHYVTLDSATALSGALRDPVGFLNGLPKPLTIDEVQRAPALMLAIKEDVDRERTSGRYLLTGSANATALPGVADSLVGRMEIATLYPLSQGEIAGVKEDFIARIFEPGFPFHVALPEYSRERLLSAICSGGYPEVLTRTSDRRRAAWFDSYVTTLIERDIRDIANIQDRGAVVRLLGLLAARTGTLNNQSELSRSSGIPNSTLTRYISLLEAMFLIFYLPAWSFNLGKRFLKTPKLHFFDTGLVASLCGADTARLAAAPELAGHLLESFVVSEIQKQSGWTEHPVRLYHYRTQAGEEADLLLEDRTGGVVALEVKLAESLSQRDMRNMAQLREDLGDRFVRGAVLYAGREVLPFGDRLLALPIGAIFGAY